MSKLKIALDYDETFNADRRFWLAFVALARGSGHDVRIVTFRGPQDTNSELSNLPKVRGLPVVFCNRTPKRDHCKTIGWEPDIWIDDSPELITQPSEWTPDDYKKWRKAQGLPE